MNAEEKQATADVSTSYALFTAALQDIYYHYMG